ncbi:hypothetical protein BZG36_04095 [Bifiguratus adelaidae]|uniref:Isopentenyl phosphate kinase n=1 Tax=Bifiguratus adelaidae TaxID=1938954 RepID=A0A261XVP7_9FUNG|nr:hypothetical protein BZG36_04095 [Bifiguratus adelaidae]
MTFELCLVKVGGAALTDKSRPSTLADPKILTTIASQLGTAFSTFSGTRKRLVIVHGVGSFGHPQAKKYNLSSGYDMENASEDEKEYKVDGVVETRQSVMTLHQKVCDLFIAQGIPAISMSPFHYVRTLHTPKSTKPDAYIRLVEAVDRALTLGYVPVLHGDAVLDDAQGCAILSGDVVIRELARGLRAGPSPKYSLHNCTFLTDVNGVFDRDPKLTMDEPPHLIQSIKISKYQVERMVNHSSSIDVTGAMTGKLQCAMNIVKDALEAGIEPIGQVIICRAASADAMHVLCGQEADNRTVVEP